MCERPSPAYKNKDQIFMYIVFMPLSSFNIQPLYFCITKRYFRYLNLEKLPFKLTSFNFDNGTFSLITFLFLNL